MFKVFALEPTSNGFNWYGNQFILTFGCIYYGIGLIGFTCFLILSCVLFVVKMRQLSSHESSATHKLQIMLFRTLMVQISLCFVTIALPIIILVYFLAVKNPYGSYYTQLGLFLLSFHGLSDTISMLYLIRPYRNYLFGLMKKMLRRKKNKIRSSAIYFT
uniref:Uncharacterized protein n=1 Tax=Acrobeloides nanus TaxID=290746 RepID=A0A914CZL6_9BILA